MTTALLLILSGVLIGTGISLVWRDVRRKRRSTFVSQRDVRAEAEPDVEITIAHRPHVALEPAPDFDPGPAPATASHSLQRVVSEIVADNGVDQRPNGARPHSLEEPWLMLQPLLAAGVDKINGVLAPAGLSVSASGEPAWSYKNRGYGAYRRILSGGESVAWLRLELAGDGRLHASVKAHKDDLLEINAAASVPLEGLSALRASDLLSECLKPAAKHAVQAPRHGNGEQDVGESAWKSVNPVVAAALKATNGALAQAGARLVPLSAPVWEAQTRRYRLPLAVEVYGNEVARMYIERLAHEMEVAVGVPDARLIDLGRRRRVPVDGMTTHALAELIASCAWPAIARFREIRRSA